MNLLKKLFGISDKKRNSFDINLNNLLESQNINKSIVELDNFICKLCDYGGKMEKLSEPQKVFFYNQTLEREVNNGGFNQYFFNSSGDFSHQTIKSLQTIGAKITADILQKAINQFPDKKTPENQMERRVILEQIEQIANVNWEKHEQRFFEYKDDLNMLNIEFVRQNKENF